MENKYKFWIVRDKKGNLLAYNDKPTRCKNKGTWFMAKFLFIMNKSFFPDLTWEDEPLEVELRPAITNLDTKTQEYADKVTDNEEIKELIINAFKAGYNI